MTRHLCDRCAVRYAPELTGYGCPVCGLAAPGAAGAARRWVDAGDRGLVLVLAATLANALLLGVLAAVAMH